MRRIPNSTCILKLCLSTVLLAGTVCSSAVTLLSEDFSGGNPVAGTGYTLVPLGSFTGPSQYRVVANPAAAFTNGYSSYFDHTLGTAAGQMMYFDGASSPIAIWQNDFTLEAGQSYTFSFWGSAGNSANVPTLSLRIDGTGVGTPLAVTDAQWSLFTYTFVPATSGLRTFSIVNLQTVGFGNDGAIDDILLTTPVPEPAAFSLMLAGVVGLVGVSARLRRQRL